MSVASQASPRDVIARFYTAEAAYMNAGGGDAGVSFADMAATLDPEVVLHQSPDLTWGGKFRGHAGYEDWARQMSRAFDRLEVKDSRFFTEHLPDHGVTGNGHGLIDEKNSDTALKPVLAWLERNAGAVPMQGGH